MKYEVWNKHPNGYTHTEKFKGEEIKIPANSYVLMDYEDAVQFKGQMTPMKFTGQGVQDPISYKCIDLIPHVEGVVVEAAPVQEFVCNMDGKKFTSQKELDEYNKQFADQAFKDPVVERDMEIARQLKGLKPKENRP